MLTEAISYPTRDDGWLKTVLIGGALSLFSFLIVPGILLQGYLMRVLAGGDEPPTFDRWGDMLVDGLKALVVTFVYGFVPTVALVLVPAIVGTFVLGFGGANGGGGGFAAVGLVAAVGLPLLFAVLLLAGYLWPAALALVAREGRLGAAFEFGSLRRVAFTGEYFVAWLVAILVLIVGGLVGSLLSLVLVGVFVLFYVNVVGYRLFATAVDDALAA